MDAEEVMKLFDYYWFDLEILTKKPSSSSPPTDPAPQIQDKIVKPEFYRLPSLLVRSKSDELSNKTIYGLDSPSPKLAFVTPKLQTIPSGKVFGDSRNQIINQEEIQIPFKKVSDRRRRSSSKSLSDLEFEEVKGFMDLGFVFSEEDKDSRLVSIIPGLQRLGKKDGEEETVDESSISRPYLSEAWDDLDRRREKNPLMNWRIPDLGNEIDMKDHLRSWAHTVASTVR